MKTLLLIRHAKSGWDDASLPDFERTLTGRGKSDAQMMAKRLIKKSIRIDAFVSSPAKRAKKTAEIFMKEFDEDEKKIELISSLYEASVKDFYDAIEIFNDKYDTIALFAHNPGITDFTNSLRCSSAYSMPTCAVFVLEIKSKHWEKFREAEKKFLFFDYPKNEE
jgi:phosphohistidine phosphatase